MRSAIDRDSTFDQLKGILVLLMIVYHVLSIATTAPAESFLYIRFISGSFIFISGYVISRFAMAEFRLNPGITTGRLIRRGLKILVLFTALNLALQLSGLAAAKAGALAAAGGRTQLAWIYLTADPRLASFIILLPISHLLIVSPLVLALAREHVKLSAIALLALALVLGSVAAITEISPNIEFMLVGLIGMALGLLYRGPNRARSPNALLAAIGVGFSVWLTARLGSTVSGYAAGIALLLGSTAALVVALPQVTWVEVTLAELGRYSLLCYIAQIAIIQAIFRSTASQRWDAVAPVLALAAGTAVLLVAVCNAVDAARRQWIFADKSYRLVFS